MNEKPKTARSYRGTILDDNAIISINLRWLFQAALIVAGLVYSYLEIKESAATNERRITELEEKISRYKSFKHFWKTETKIELTEDDFNHKYFINRELRRVRNG